MTASESVKHEIDRLGIDMSRHMIEFYGDFLNAIGAVRSSDLLKQRSQSSVLVAGIKVAMQTPPVRSGKRVIFLTLDDGYGLSDSTFFTDVQSEYANVLYSTSLLLVRGVTRRTGARGISIRATGAWDLRAAYESWSAKQSTLAI
jgi:error-prone DNA polymerase